jgi:hypothetical protein
MTLYSFELARVKSSADKFFDIENKVDAKQLQELIDELDIIINEHSDKPDFAPIPIFRNIDKLEN